MKLKNLNFSTWRINHSEDHDAKWCRELYPYRVFREIDFSENKIGIEQTIKNNFIRFYITIVQIKFQQDNQRYRATFKFSTKYDVDGRSWRIRNWDTIFQIVYSVVGDFITVFTKDDDPSKLLVQKFMKGDFAPIVSDKSLPVSELLFRTLILQLSEVNYPNGKHDSSFSLKNENEKLFVQHSMFKVKGESYSPIYSVGRTRWICYAFSEQRAHRIAFSIANQCDDLIVVFCNTTYTSHHRCLYPNVKVVSIYEYANIISPNFRVKYMNQIRFLQNHMEGLQTFSAEQLVSEIEKPNYDHYEITQGVLMEAFGVMKISPINEFDVFYSLAALNTINAWMSNTKLKINSLHKKKLMRKLYYFKAYVSKIFTFLICNRSHYAKISITADLYLVEIFNFQFSFHHIERNEILDSFKQGSENKEIIWRGKRLQPIAPLILAYARELKIQHSDKEAVSKGV